MSAAPAPSLAWGWRAVAHAPEPRAAVGWGRNAACALHARLIALGDDAQARLTVCAGADVLVVQGAPADLPWAEGVAYAAPCADTPELWCPTLQMPDVPVDLLARALHAHFGRSPLLLWPQATAALPMDRQARLTPEVLARIGAALHAPVAA